MHIQALVFVFDGSKTWIPMSKNLYLGTSGGLIQCSHKWKISLDKRPEMESEKIKTTRQSFDRHRFLTIEEFLNPNKVIDTNTVQHRMIGREKVKLVSDIQLRLMEFPIAPIKGDPFWNFSLLLSNRIFFAPHWSLIAVALSVEYFRQSYFPDI